MVISIGYDVFSISKLQDKGSAHILIIISVKIEGIENYTKEKQKLYFFLKRN